MPEKVRGLKMQTGEGDCIFPFCCQLQYNVAFIHLQLLPYPFQSCSRSGAYPQNTPWEYTQSGGPVHCWAPTTHLVAYIYRNQGEFVVTVQSNSML